MSEEFTSKDGDDLHKLMQEMIRREKEHLRKMNPVWRLLFYWKIKV